jgi:competence protein ComEA
MKRSIDILIGVLLGLLAAGALFMTTRPQATGTPIALLPTPTSEPIVVYVTGSIQRPGVYTLPRDSRMVNLVEAAGGFSPGADLNQVNLAELLKDEDRITIPGLSTTATPELTIDDNGLLVTPTPFTGEKVNINTADITRLDTLPGIGPSTAQKIIDYRDANGPFKTIEELLKIPGIGPSTLEKIRGLITLS